MKALYFAGAPLDVEFLKSKDPARFTILGMYVYISTVFQALLKHSTYDRIFLPPVAPASLGDLRDSTLFAENRNRLEFVGEYELHKLQQQDHHLVFVTPLADLSSMARLRRISGCYWAPITGIIHSINYTQQLWIILQQLLSPLESYDALICSSTAGQLAMTNFIELVCARSERLGWPPLTPRFQMPIIPLGVEISTFEKASAGSLRRTLELDDNPVVLYFGRFSASSKADLLPLVLAFGQVHSSHPNVSFVLAGDDTHFEMADILRDFARQVAPGAQIRVVPNPDLETKRQIYAMADVFVSPTDSLQETFGISVVEAMAAGLPVVVSDWNGYKDLVIHGETGYRVRTTLPNFEPRFDDLRGSGAMLLPDLLAATTMIDIQELVSAIAGLVAAPEKRKALGDAARRRARALFDWPVVIASYENLWTKLLSQESLREMPASEQSLSVAQFGYKEIFSHYPSGFLTADSRIRLTHIGAEWSNGYDWLSKTVGSVSWFRPKVFERILELLGHQCSVEVSTLLIMLNSQDEVERILNIAHLCRLIKYGLIASAPPE